MRVIMERTGRLDTAATEIRRGSWWRTRAYSRAGRAPHGYARRGCAHRKGGPAGRRGRPRCRCRATTRPVARSVAGPCLPRKRLVALTAVRAEAGGDRVGGREQETVGAGAVTVGDDHDRGRVGRVQQRIELSRVERGTVAGDAQRALEPLCQRPRRRRGQRPRSGLPRRRPRRPARPGWRAAEATEPSRVTTIVRSIEVVSASATSTSPTIARARSSRSSPATLSPRRRLAWAKCLTGRIAAVRICPQTIVSEGLVYQPSSIRPTVTPGPIVTIRPRSPGAGSRRAIVSAST